MSRFPMDYETGYGKPPKETQFKKGRSGNPGGRSSPRSIGIVEMIDTLLLATVKIIMNGQPKQITVLEAILEQLWIKGIADDRRAMSVYLRCLELSSPVATVLTVAIRFASTEVTNPFTVQPIAGDSDDER